MGKRRPHLYVMQMPAGSKCISAYSDASYMYLMWCRIGNSIIQTSVLNKKSFGAIHGAEMVDAAFPISSSSSMRRPFSAAASVSMQPATTFTADLPGDWNWARLNFLVAAIRVTRWLSITCLASLKQIKHSQLQDSSLFPSVLPTCETKDEQNAQSQTLNKIYAWWNIYLALWQIY